MRGERREAAISRRVEHQRAERRFPDPRLTFDDDDDSRKLIRVQIRAQGSQLALAPNEPMQPGRHPLT
jgi:hypothetical protein